MSRSGLDGQDLFDVEGLDDTQEHVVVNSALTGEVMPKIETAEESIEELATTIRSHVQAQETMMNIIDLHARRIDMLQDQASAFFDRLHHVEHSGHALARQSAHPCDAEWSRERSIGMQEHVEQFSQYDVQMAPTDVLDLGSDCECIAFEWLTS